MYAKHFFLQNVCMFAFFVVPLQGYSLSNAGGALLSAATRRGLTTFSV
jgi:hypothetical protein